MPHLSKPAALAAVAAVLPVLGGGILLAEEGLNFTIGVSERLEYVDREGFSSSTDEGLRAITRLNFGLTTETRGQSLAIQVGTGLAFGLSSGAEDFETDDPSMSLNYRLESRNSGLTVSAAYTESDLDDGVFLDEDTDEFIISDNGERTSFRINTGLVFGREGPVTLSFNHLYSQSDFTGTTDPDLQDTTVNELRARALFQLTPITTLDINASHRRSEEDGPLGEDRTTNTISIGGTTELSKRTSLSAAIFYDEIDNDGDSDIEDTDGIGFTFGVNHLVPNGAYNVSFSSRETLNGNRQQISVGRTLELKRGDLFFSLGATKTEGFDLQPIAQARLNYALTPLSRIQLDLSQSAATGNDDTETVRTQLAVNYTRELTRLSSLSAGLQFANQNVLADTGNDTRSISANINYRHDVGQDWDLVSGYSHSATRSDAANDRTTNTLFISLEKTFSFRP